LSTTTTSTHGDDTADDRARWLDELTSHLGAGSFPTTHDHLTATLIQRHAPSHLLWHLSGLPRTREFQSLTELVEALDRLAPPVE
jgi:hypothetical protein